MSAAPAAPIKLDLLFGDLLDGLELAQVAGNHDLSLAALLDLLARPDLAARLHALRDLARLRLELMALDARATAISALKRLCFAPSDDIARRAASSLLRAHLTTLNPPSPPAETSSRPLTPPPPPSPPPSPPPGEKVPRPPGEADEGPSQSPPPSPPPPPPPSPPPGGEGASPPRRGG